MSNLFQEEIENLNKPKATKGSEMIIKDQSPRPRQFYKWILSVFQGEAVSICTSDAWKQKAMGNCPNPLFKNWDEFHRTHFSARFILGD